MTTRPTPELAQELDEQPPPQTRALAPKEDAGLKSVGALREAAVQEIPGGPSLAPGGNVVLPSAVHTDQDALNVRTMLHMQFPNPADQQYFDAYERRILQMADQIPEVYDAMYSSVEIALTMDDAAVFQAWRSGATDEAQALAEAVYDQVRIEGAEIQWTQRRVQEQEIMRNEWGRRSLDRTEVRAAAEAQVQGEVEVEGGVGPPVSVFESMDVTAFGEWQSRLNEGSFRWGTVEGRIVAEGPNDQVFSVVLDPGVEIKNDADAQAAMALALAGIAHRVEVRGAVEDPDSTLEQGIGAAMGWAADQIDPAYQASWQRGVVEAVTEAQKFLLEEAGQIQEVDFRARAEGILQAALPDDAILAMASTQIQTEFREANLSNAEAINLARAALEDDDYAEFRAQFVEQNAEELVEGLRSELLDLEGGTTVERNISALLGTTLSSFEVLDSVAQYIGIEVFDAFTSLGLDIADLAGVDIEEAEGALGRLREAADRDLEFGDRFSDHFGLEGAAGAWADFTVSVVFDPLNVFFPGGSGRNRIMREVLTDRKFADQLVNMPAMRSMVDNIVGTVDDAGLDVNRLMRQFAAMDGIRPETLVQVYDGLRSGAGRDVIERVLVDEVYDNAWRPMSFGHATARGTALGLGETIQNWDLIPQGAREQMSRTLFNLSSENTMRLTGQGAFDDFKRVLVQVFADDGDSVARWMQEWVETTADPIRQVAALEEAAGTMTQRIKELSARITDESFQSADRQLGQLQSHLDDLRRTVTVRGADAFGDDTIFAEAERQLVEQIQQVSDQLAPVSALRGEREQLNTTIRRLAQRGLDYQSRDPEIEFIHRFYAEIGERLGLQQVDGGVPGFTHIARYDWSDVRFGAGENGFYGGGRGISRTEGFGLDKANTQNLNELGVLSLRSYQELPASAAEIVAYQFGQNNPAALEAIRNSIVAQRVRVASSQLRRVFAYGLLFNPITPIKTRLDEAIGFYIRHGNARESIRSMFGAIDLDAADPLTRQAAREVDQTLDVTQRGWGRLPNPGGRRGMSEFTREAERFINGGLLQDDLFQTWAAFQRGVIDETELNRWWVDVGQGRYSGRMVELDDVGRTKVQSAADPLRVMEQSFDGWLASVLPDDEVLRGRLRERMIEAVTGGETISITRDAQILRNMEWVLGQEPAQRGLTNTLFHTLYGAPTQRSAGVMFESLFEPRLDDLMTRSARQGRLLTADRLIEMGVTDSLDEAAFMLKRASRDPRVRQLLGRGMVTEDMLRMQAADYAQRGANDLMFNMTSSSMLGQGLDTPLAFPFLRAQTDFIGRMTRAITDGNVTRIPRETLQAMEAAGGVASIASRGIGSLERMPLNLRLLSKWSKLALAASDERNEDSFFTPGNFLNAFTFLPLRMGDSFLMNVVPQPGPSVSAAWYWAEGRIPEETAAAINALWPTLEFALNDIGPSFEGGDILDLFVPVSDRSSRGQLGHAMQAFGAEHIGQWVMGESEPAGIAPAMRGSVGEMLTEMAFTNSPVDQAWEDRLRDAGHLTRNQLLRGEGFDGLAGIIPGFGGYELDTSNLVNFEVVAGDNGLRETFVQFGALLEADVNDLFGDDGMWTKYTQGRATNDEIRLLNNRLQDITWRAADIDYAPGFTYTLSDGSEREVSGVSLLDMALLQSPALAANLVSTFSCTPQSGGGYFSTRYCSPEGKLLSQNIPQSEEQELRRQWLDEGKIGYRQENEWATEAHQWTQDAARRVLRYGYSIVVGRDYGAGNTKALDEATISTSVNMEMLRFGLESIGFDTSPLDAGSITGADLRTLTRSAIDSLTDPTIDATLFDNNITQAMQRGGFSEHVEAVRSLATDFQKAGVSSPFDWPDEHREYMRTLGSAMVDEQIITADDYARSWARAFGQLDYEPPSPPAPEDADEAFTLPREAWERNEVHVVDGDTLTVLTDSGALAVRLIGINTPESGQDGAADAAKAFEDFIQAHIDDNIQLVVFEPERFGLVQEFSPGNFRLKAWLYVNGQPVWDPSVFAATNPEGRELGGVVPDYESMIGGS